MMKAMARGAVVAGMVATMSLLAAPAGAKTKVPSSGVACLPGGVTTCVAVGQNATTSLGSIARTTDGGATWQAVASPAGKQTYNAVTCPTTTVCVAVGRKGGVVSTNGGASWIKSSFDYGSVGVPNLTSVSCPTKKDCFAAGTLTPRGLAADGVVERSSDGGRTWSATLHAGPLGGIACVSKLTCVTAGRVAFHTESGGITWTQQTFGAGLSSPLSAVACATSLLCFAVGTNLAVLHDVTVPGVFEVTTDGSQTPWSSVSSPPASTGTVREIACTPTTGACFAGGLAPSIGAAPSFASLASPSDQWASATVPTGFASVTALSCPSDATCVALGTSSAGKTVFASGTLAGGVWSWVAAP